MDDSRPFAGQVAVVTGAASGIGRAIALRLAAGGAHVAIVDLQDDLAAKVADDVRRAGTRALALRANVAESADVESALRATASQLGAPTILVNNAGVSRGGRIQDIAENDWDFVIGVNLRGTYLFCKYAVPLMVEQQRGRIINISSGTAVRVGPGSGPYGASKAGIIALTKSIAGEVARYGITANVVAPGITDTPMTRGQFGSEEQLREQATSGRIANPMRVVIQPEDIAHAVAFLALPESRYITGQTLHVNAGSFMP
jgi:NAD(P)-dependent dehydrogenase (short-subunit alcohol dehydrogenase family)